MVTPLRHSTLLAFLERWFPALIHWSRMPGLISWAAVSFGTAIAFLLPFHWCSGICPAAPVRSWTAVPLAALLCCTGILVRTALVRFGAFFLFALALGVMHRAHQTEVFDGLREPARAAVPATLVGKVVSPPLPWQENFHFLLKIDPTCGAPLQTLRNATVHCVCPAEPPQYGWISVNGTYTLPRTRRNPFEYDEFTAMMAAGVWGTFTAGPCAVSSGPLPLMQRLAAAFRNVTLATLQKVKDYDNRALLQASFLGDTEFLSPSIKNIFRKSGIYHLIAISGLNTAMLASALFFFLRLFPLGRNAPYLICIAALWAYLPFVGMIPSLFRATVMATCVTAALLFEKKSYALHTLGLAGTLWLCLSPESLFLPGYQLSFAATAGLFTLYPVFSRFTPKPKNRFARSMVTFLFSSLWVSLASFLATAPVLLYHFGTLSFFGLAANLVAVAAMTVAMWAFFAGLFLQMLLPFLAAVPLWVSERFMDLIVLTGKAADLFPWSQKTYPVPPVEIILLFVLFLIGLSAVRRERMQRFFFVSIALAALALGADVFVRESLRRTEVVQFALPKTQAIGIRWPDRKVWLIVADPQSSLPRLTGLHVVPWLRHRCRGRVDALIVPRACAAAAESSAYALPALASARLLTFADADRTAVPHDSLLSVLTPGDRCTCRIAREGQDISVGVAAPDFTATLVLKPEISAAQKQPSDPEAPRAAEETVSALVFTARGKGTSTRQVVVCDHPAR
jgi:competence protein ComEC